MILLDYQVFEISFNIVSYPSCEEHLIAKYQILVKAEEKKADHHRNIA